MRTNQNKKYSQVLDFEQQWLESLTPQLPNHYNWLGDNWLFVADWSDNYGWEDWFFEGSLSSSPLSPNGGICNYTYIPSEG